MSKIAFYGLRVLASDAVMTAHAGRRRGLIVHAITGLALLGGCVGVLAPGCLVTDPPQWPFTGGFLQGGSCMCAMCLDKPFCMDADRKVTKIDFPSDPCAGDVSHPLTASRAQRVTGPGNPDFGAVTNDAFFCIFDEASMNLAADKGVCPADQAQRGLFEGVNPCIDLPVGCLSGEQAVQCNKIAGPDAGPDDPPCPTGAQKDSERTACGDNSSDNTLHTGFDRAVDSVVAQCSLYGSAPPSGTEAKRYCFTSCLDFTNFSGPCADSPSELCGGVQCKPTNAP